MSSSQPQSFGIKASHKFVAADKSSSISVLDYETQTVTKSTVDTESTRKESSTQGMSIRACPTSLEDYY
jgi:hypothetical protein|tara:strand:- start:755 stop:961 length:207 start_codon:yes stop_codon:yes gene_type:complete